MEKDIIKVMMADGSQKDMELVLMYNDKKTQKNYVLYKDLNEDDECYAASFVMHNDVYELNPDLTNEEIMKLQLLCNSMAERDNKNEN